LPSRSPVLPALVAGSHAITAVYTPDANSSTLATSTSAEEDLSGELTVQGTVSYSGSQTGIVYVNVLANGTILASTSVPWPALTTSPQSFAIHGLTVPPSLLGQTAYLAAEMAIQPSGGQNALDPSTGNPNATQYPSPGTPFTLSSSSVILTANLADPPLPAAAPAAGSANFQVYPFVSTIGSQPGGAMILRDPVLAGGLQAASSYTLYWNATNTFTSLSSLPHVTFPAVQDNRYLFTDSRLQPGNPYYFELVANTPQGQPYTYPVSPVITIANLTTGTAFNGSIQYPSTTDTYSNIYVAVGDNQDGFGVTEVGFSDNLTYALTGPAGPASQLSVLLDQNTTTVATTPTSNLLWAGVLAPDDLYTSVAASGTPTTLVLPSYALSTVGLALTLGQGSGSSESLEVTLQNPVANIIGASLLPGANLPGFSDQANPFGGHSFNASFPLPQPLPAGSYPFTVEVYYSDGSSTTTQNLSVTASDPTTAVAPVNLAVSSSPDGPATPTFSWSAPGTTLPAGDTYQFYITDNNGFTWTAPGIPISTAQCAYPTDPTVAPPLASNVTYNWGVAIVDANNNQDWTLSSYTVPLATPTVAITPVSPQTIPVSQSLTFNATVTGNPGTITWQDTTDPSGQTGWSNLETGHSQSGLGQRSHVPGPPALP
jgi:hypothetical protein